MRKPSRDRISDASLRSCPPQGEGGGLQRWAGGTGLSHPREKDQGTLGGCRPPKGGGGAGTHPGALPRQTQDPRRGLDGAVA